MIWEDLGRIERIWGESGQDLGRIWMDLARIWRIWSIKFAPRKSCAVLRRHVTHSQIMRGTHY